MVYRIPDFALASYEILYGLPDHPHILQTFFWQAIDTTPDFPRLIKFLRHWEQNIPAPLVSVRVAHQSLIRPSDFRYTRGELILQ